MKVRWLLLAVIGVVLVVVSILAIRSASRSSTQVAKTEGGGAAGGICDATTKQASFDFTLPDMHGKSVELASYKGQVVLLNFWATWCGPCKYEIPAFVELQDKYREQGFIALGVSTDDPPEKLKTFAAEYKMNYPVLMGRDRDDILEAYGPIWAIPVSFFIGRDGTICKKHMGYATKEQFEEIIKSLL